MAQQRIIWTVLPYGRVGKGPFAGRLRVSVIASPRLTPQTAAEHVLKAFPEWLNWPKTLGKVKELKLFLRIGRREYAPVILHPVSESDPELWARLFEPNTPVAGFAFKNMSLVNLRSYPVRNLLGFVRKHYAELAVKCTGTHPTLLPWKEAHPSLKDMLKDLGTPENREEILKKPGFARFFDDREKDGVEDILSDLVFGKRSRYTETAAGIGADEEGNPQPGPEFGIRVLPPDWITPSGSSAFRQIMSQFRSSAEYALYQADRFYRRRAQPHMRRPNLQNIPASPELPKSDFHNMVASYADYPELLRKIGLVIDCVLPETSPIDNKIAASGQVAGLMGLEIVWGAAHSVDDDHCPRTAWHADQERFTTRERSDDHERGMLRLEHACDRWNEKQKVGPFYLYQLDPDGTGIKTADFLLTAQRLIAKSLEKGPDSEVTHTTGNKQGVAALRSGGLGLLRHGRAVVIAQSAASAALKDQQIQSSPAAARKIVLFAEDVLRGYRVDVQPLPKRVAQKWQSLCRRHGIYRFAGTSDTIDLSDDEGYVKGASTTSNTDPDVNPEDHYLHESMFRWTGWSLVVPRPGRTLRSKDNLSSGVQEESAEDISDEVVEGGNGLSVDFSAPKGSLPRLRFGTPYRMRARIVDLAGNSLPHHDKSLDKDRNATDPVTYWRFEPVDPPAMLHRARTSEGESLERMVIRSNWDVNANAYLSTEAFASSTRSPESVDFEYNERNERHFVPPKSSQLQCEQHGLFDALLGSPADIKKAYAIASREAGTLYDSGPSTQIELVTPASLKAVATTTEVPLKLPSPDNPTGDRLTGGQYVIHRQEQVETPYLPDPAAGGIALRAMPGHALPGVTGPMELGPSARVIVTRNGERMLLVRYGKDWPECLGFRIVLAERKEQWTDPQCNENFADAGTPEWDEQTRVLTFFLSKGSIAHLRYASFVHERFIGAFGLLDWIESDGDKDYVQEMAKFGCAWLITPYRPLTLVHATQQPVCEPTLIDLSAYRDPGEQHATLKSGILLHGPSTGKFEIEGEWKEWVDDLDKETGPELISSFGQLGEVQLGENHANRFSLDSAVKAQMHDPINRPRASGNRHEFGDTKFRLICYRIRATTRFREYFPGVLCANRDEVTRRGPIAKGPMMNVGAPNDPGAPVLRSASGDALHTPILASAPPDEPRLLYTVPTFRWMETTSRNNLDSTRLGNGLRVWLKRPWFSSGNGELLGVVYFEDKASNDSRFTAIPDKMVPVVTQWGRDPIWDTAAPKHRIRVSDFPARVTHEQLELQEVGGENVRVVGHRVHWDSERKLWYCDIEIDPGQSYMPFVRLALVRYQPNALPAAKISKVVLTEFAQVLPRRRAVFQRQGSQLDFVLRGCVPFQGPMKYNIDSEYLNISFPPPFGMPGETGQNKVELVLQTRDPALVTDLAWRDIMVLSSSVVGPAGGPVGTADPGPASPKPAGHADRLSNTVRDSQGRRVNLGAIDVGRTVRALGDAAIAATLLDPEIWKTTVTLPQNVGKVARVAVREYERYYTDRTILERRAGRPQQRRVVEERLVYTAFFEL